MPTRTSDRFRNIRTEGAIFPGVQVLDQLRRGVERAIVTLGTGFLSCPANHSLSDSLRTGKLSAQDYYRQLLRLVYRLLFLFVAEDRKLLFTTATGCPELGLSTLGSGFFSPQVVPDLEECQLADADLLAAVRSLALIGDGQAERPIDFRNLGSEDLGRIYESLLGLHPVYHPETRTFELSSASGTERKTSGSYYTPTSVITYLLDSALDPILDEAARKPDAEAAILALKVCDPACGCGHFLIAAAHRIARRLAAVRTGKEEPPPEAGRATVRDVIGYCVYGVDIDPMAVDLCKVILWLEAGDPGTPLSFLDHHIRCGNSLHGVHDLRVLPSIPDAAFRPTGRDDKKVASVVSRANREERDQTREGPRVSWDHDGMACNTWLCSYFVELSAEKAKARQIPTTADVRHVTTTGTLRSELAEEVSRVSSDARFFHWPLEFPEVVARGGFDVILANPPYDVIRENRLLRSSVAGGTNNLFGHFIVRAIELLSPRGSLGIVIPLALACGDEYEAVRQRIYLSFGTVKASHYSIRPAKLFPNVDQRLTLMVALGRGESPCKLFSTRLHRWYPGQEERVLSGAEFGLIGCVESGIMAKTAGPIGAAIYGKLLAQRATLRDWRAEAGHPAVAVYYHAIARYWIKAYSFLPFFQRVGDEPGVSTNLRTVALRGKSEALWFLCLLNSSLFYSWWLSQSDEFHVLESEVFGFPVPHEEQVWPGTDVLEKLVNDLMSSYQDNAIRRQRRFGGRLVDYDEFRPRLSLREISAIDQVVGRVYELSEAEQAFLASYDLEFRTDDEVIAGQVGIGYVTPQEEQGDGSEERSMNRAFPTGQERR